MNINTVMQGEWKLQRQAQQSHETITIKIAPTGAIIKCQRVCSSIVWRLQSTTVHASHTFLTISRSITKILTIEDHIWTLPIGYHQLRIPCLLIAFINF